MIPVYGFNWHEIKGVLEQGINWFNIIENKLNILTFIDIGMRTKFLELQIFDELWIFSSVLNVCKCTCTRVQIAEFIMSLHIFEHISRQKIFLRIE